MQPNDHNQLDSNEDHHLSISQGKILDWVAVRSEKYQRK